MQYNEGQAKFGQLKCQALLTYVEYCRSIISESSTSGPHQTI